VRVEVFMNKSIVAFVFLLILVCLPIAIFGQKKLPVKSVKSEAGVAIESVQAFSDGKGVYVRWSTARETDNLGFYVVRVDGGKKTLIDRFVAGSALKANHQTLYGEQYSVFDKNGTPQSQYIIESFELNGNHAATEPVYPNLIADLSTVTEAPSQSLMAADTASTSSVVSSGVVYPKGLQSSGGNGHQLADPVTQKWVAAQPGAKIGVRQTGMYRVTKSQLAAAGFDVNSDINLWQLYSDGVEQAIIVEPSGNYIDFYGKGIDTIESNTRVYYLVVGTHPGRRMANVGFRPAASTVKAHNFEASVSLKERQNYITNLLNGDADNFYGHLITNTHLPTMINVSGVDPLASQAHVTLAALGYSGAAHVFSVSLNGHPIGQLTGNGIQTMSLDVVVPAGYLVEGANALDIVSQSSTDFGFFDQAQITYERRHIADQNRIAFTTQNYRGATLQNFSSANIRVFDIADTDSPAVLTGASIVPDGGTFDVNIPAYRARVMYAIEDSGLLSPASILLNSPSTLSTTNHSADLVIISYKDFMTQANSWADYRRGQGVNVEVVNVEDIFDEFNFGVFSANSLKDFLNFARQNWATPPRYVLLIGDGSYDPLNYEGNGSWDLVPAKFFDSDNAEAPSDDALVDFDNDGLAEMAIGRIPARDASMVTNALNKTISFEGNIAPQNISRGFTCNYDNPIGWDFQGMCQMMANQFPAGTPTGLIARADTNPNNALIGELNNGRFFVNFSGHGTLASWSSANNFRVFHVPLLTNINGLSVYTMLTCLNGYYVGAGTSLAEALVNSTTGGAAAAWASTTETTPDIQQIMGVHFYSQVAAGQITRLGDLILDAKSVVPGGRDVRLSWVLMGDPMLKTR
jgi:hypothetical protein